MNNVMQLHQNKHKERKSWQVVVIHELLINIVQFSEILRKNSLGEPASY